jgi:drug/metabolite transporter (DMT)-like permease
MRVLAAYLGVILIWSTTPLAIKWSGEGPGYLFGVTTRMSFGLAIVLLMLLLTRTSLRRDTKARQTYMAGALQIYGSMLATYWASQHIPSGWISVVFGLTPLLTAPMAAIWLGEPSLTPARLMSYVLGVTGLALMFQTALTFSPSAVFGIAGVLLAALLQAISSVWVKRAAAQLSGLALLAGSLLLAVPAYWLTWVLLDGHWPGPLPRASLWSIAYLGGIATPLGFTWYFFVLRHLPTGRVALITLITPVISLYVGHALNREVIHPSVLGGTALIIAALLLYEAGGLRRGRLSSSRPQPEP